MLDVAEALQQVEFTTNAAGQSVVQLSLPAWETIHAAMQPLSEPSAETLSGSEDDDRMMQLFLDFITTEALKNNTLQPYTVELSQAAHHLIAGVTIDYS
jgi:hypothetical protein